MKYLVVLLMFTVGCAAFQRTEPVNPMTECRKLCKFGVKEYSDDNVTCSCKEK